MAAPASEGWRPIRVLLALPICLAALWAGCSPVEPDRGVDALAASRTALAEGDAAAALAAANKARANGADGPEARLLAATAANMLKRWTEGQEHAAAGLAAGASGAVRADLHWAQGHSALALTRELGSEEQWRLANTSLESATDGGGHRADAAYMLVLLQVMSPKGSTERMERFTALLEQLEPGSERAVNARGLTASRSNNP